MSDGRVLAGRYRLEHVLGQGGMAEVHAAHDEVLNRPVAVKLLATRFAQDAQFIQRFRHEAQAAASLNHPNIVAVYDTGEHDGLPFIVMEQVRGRSLQQAIRAGGLTEDRALEVCAEVCSALSYAHGRGLVHRDVKPGNILLADDGTVKVTDFGIARAIDADTVTQTAAVLGTAAYLSPEQAQGMPADARSDIYSLGVVLYEILTGQQPFQGDSPVTVAYQHVQELPRPPLDWDETISTAAEAIAVRAMAKNPSNRYQDAEAMRDDLLRARVGKSITAPAVMRAEDTAMLDALPTADHAPRTESAERRRRTVGFVLLGVLSVVAAALAVWYAASLLAGDETQRIEVPGVLGQPLSEAQEVLEARGLEWEVVGETFSDRYEPNAVAEQVPSGGTLVSEGDVIRLTLSRGQELIPVPDVREMPVEEALATLREAGLVPRDQRQEASDDIDSGLVISTEPDAGERVPGGTPVDLVVSSGEETVRVPPVEGLSESEARFRLQDDFNVLTVREFSDTVEEGRVISQDPESGTELPKGADVTIVVSRGPQEQPSPSPSPTPTGPVIIPTAPGSPEPSPSPTGTGTGT